MSVILKIPRASGGICPWAPYQSSTLGPLPEFYPGPAGDLKRSPDPSPTHAPPLPTNPGSAPDIILVYSRRSLETVEIIPSYSAASLTHQKGATIGNAETIHPSEGRMWV